MRALPSRDSPHLLRPELFQVLSELEATLAYSLQLLLRPAKTRQPLLLPK